MNPILTLLTIWRRRYLWWRVEHEGAPALQPVTVITGGSEGIGLALAREFARLGQPLLLVARSADALASAKNTLAAERGIEVLTVAADLTQQAGVAAVLAALAARNATCDVLINNAGIGLSGPFEHHDGRGLARLVNLNVAAVTLLMHAVLPGMLARGRGGILNVASLGGLAPGPWQAAYYASKAYVVSLTEAVAWETRGLGVRIAVLLPGPVVTQFHHRMGADSAYYLSLLWPLRPECIARAAWRGFRYGGVRIVPGVVSKVLCVALWLVPNMVLVPIVGWLLKQR